MQGWPVVLQDLADARVSLTGHAKALPQDRQEAVKSVYKSKNPESFWADFGDFQPFYMEEVVAVHFNGGFGRAGRKVSFSSNWLAELAEYFANHRRFYQILVVLRTASQPFIDKFSG